MLSKIRLYIYSALAGLSFIVFAWIKHLSKKNDKLEQKVEVLQKNEVVKEEVKQIETKVQESLNEVRIESEKVHNENTKKAISRKRPSGSFNDSRIDRL